MFVPMTNQIDGILLVSCLCACLSVAWLFGSVPNHLPACLSSCLHATFLVCLCTSLIDSLGLPVYWLLRSFHSVLRLFVYRSVRCLAMKAQSHFQHRSDHDYQLLLIQTNRRCCSCCCFYFYFYFCYYRYFSSSFPSLPQSPSSTSSSCLSCLVSCGMGSLSPPTRFRPTTDVSTRPHLCYSLTRSLTHSLCFRLSTLGDCTNQSATTYVLSFTGHTRQNLFGVVYTGSTYFPIRYTQRTQVVECSLSVVVCFVL